MSSTVIEQLAARPPPSSTMSEEKISSDNTKFSLGGNIDFQTSPPKEVVDEKVGSKTAQGSLLSAASALTSLVKVSPSKEEDMDEENDEDFEIPLRFTKSGRKRAIPFPLKLMKVLSHKEYQEIITWLPDGKSFTILKPKAFVTEILSKESGLGFKAAKYSSFTRKLHRWGFLRHYRGDEAGAFYHKMFMRDRLDLVEKMTCNKIDPPKAPTATNEAPRHPKPSVAAIAAEKVLQRQQIPPLQQRGSIPPRPGIVAEHLRHAPHRSLMASQLMQRTSLPLGPGSAVTQNLSSSERLNAAIELEVTRRLKERVAAAALSRHALAMMQQQMVPGAAAAAAAFDVRGPQPTQQQQQHFNALQNHRRASNPLASLSALHQFNPMMLNSKSRALLNHHHSGVVMDFQLANRMGGSLSNVQGPFQSNIEGAKTA